LSALPLFYIISTLYHTVRTPKIRYTFRVLDHVGIYLVIAGSYTPFTLVSMRAGHGWALFGLIWGLALAGAIFKTFMTHRLAFLAPVFYIALGWLIVIDLEGLLTMVPLKGVLWLLAGGLVVAGSFCHYLAVLWYVIPVGVLKPT
jgi:hemolysin III